MKMKKQKAFKIWREIAPERRAFGLKVWLTGGEVYLGKLHYRVRWGFRK